jgi:hypothetical protein
LSGCSFASEIVAARHGAGSQYQPKTHNTTDFWHMRLNRVWFIVYQNVKWVGYTHTKKSRKLQHGHNHFCLWHWLGGGADGGEFGRYGLESSAYPVGYVSYIGCAGTARA